MESPKKRRSNGSQEPKKYLGTKILEFNKKIGLDKAANKVAKAVGKKDCGCKKRARTIDNLHETVSNMFQGNKDGEEQT